jgi:hypothetical protein
MYADILSVLMGIIAAALSSVGTLIFKQRADKAINQSDEAEVQMEISASRGRLEEGKKTSYL